jgi:glycosyltransferase involved in cell wall biosynthesis
MKIVQANKFFYPKGGADKYFLDLSERLARDGDTVIPFAMADKHNLATPWKEYFSPHIDYHRPSQAVRAARRLIWNRAAAKKFGQLLDDTKPDIIHVHNIYHQLSPAILIEAKKRQLPVVMTLHDYKLICPNYLMFTHGHNCDRCLRGNYWPCLFNNCYRSYPRSALAAFESFWHQRIWHVYRDNVDRFISPSIYLRDLMVKAGWPAEKIIVLTNPAPDYQPQPDGKNLLYIGRLSPEKGVDVLLKAVAATADKLDIVGDGHAAAALKRLSAALDLEKQVTFHGFLSGAKLEKLKQQAKAIIIPSLWAENMPLVLLEALSYGKLVIASDGGGIPELITDGQTGFLVPPGKIEPLVKKIKALNQILPEERQRIAQNIATRITPLNWYNHQQHLKLIYQGLVEKNKNR